MNKALLSTLAAGAAAISSASINFNLDSDFATVTAGGSTTFTGTVKVTQGYHATGATYESASNGTDALTVAFAPSFSTYLASGTGDYTGDIFKVTAPLSASGGLYDLGAGGLDPTAEIFVTGTNGTKTAVDNEHYSVQVAPVPEPASYAVLGVGAMGLLRRRRRA